MEPLLSGGDFRMDAFGHPVTISGAQELLQRVLIRLSVKRGAFRLDPSLGSNLYLLKVTKSLDRDALTYAKEALIDIPDIRVLSAHVELEENGSATVLVRVKAFDQTETVSVGLQELSDAS